MRSTLNIHAWREKVETVTLIWEVCAVVVVVRSSNRNHLEEWLLVTWVDKSNIIYLPELVSKCAKCLANNDNIHSFQLWKPVGISWFSVFLNALNIWMDILYPPYSYVSLLFYSLVLTCSKPEPACRHRFSIKRGVVKPTCDHCQRTTHLGNSGRWNVAGIYVVIARSNRQCVSEVNHSRGPGVDCRIPGPTHRHWNNSGAVTGSAMS